MRRVGINTRLKNREPVPAVVQLIVSDSAAKMIKLNVPRKAEDNVAIINGQLVDIGALGCGVEVPYLIPVGIELGISIDTTNFRQEMGGDIRKEPIKASAKVTTCIMKAAGSYRLGLYFIDISQDDKTLIEDFIKARERRKDSRWDMSK